MKPPRPDSCLRAERAIHALLDGDLAGAEERAWLERHRGECASCRELEIELLTLQRGLRALPVSPFPDLALAAVFARTSRARRPSLGRLYRLAAAAVVAACLFGLAAAIWRWNRTPPATEISEADLQQAAADVRLVLGLTGRALHRTGQAAIGDVLGREVSDALRRVPITWPERRDVAGSDDERTDQRRKSRT